MTAAELKAAEAEPEVVPAEIEMREARSLGELVNVEAAAPPAPAPRGGGRMNWLFVVTVIVPALVAGLYLFVIAADRYRSEAKFIVRSTGGTSVAFEAGAMGGGSLSRAGEDAFIVDDYIVSRDALDRLVKEKGLEEVFSRPEADVFNRFPPLIGPRDREQLYDYYKSMVKTWVDGSTGISTIQVTAFRSEDALALTRALLVYAETIVNQINDRANADRVAFARRLVDQAKAGAADAERRLTDFRTASGMVDPMREYQAALMNIGRLSTEASQREAALSQQVALTPNGPGIASLREKVKSLRDEIARQSRELAGGANSLAVKLAGFDRLTLERDIATKELISAEVNLDTSQREAGQQRLYLQPVTTPNLPDVPDGPRRTLWFLVTLGTSLVIYATLRRLKASAEDHAL